eukprot:1954806-Ditylum_brightwellii.AAC.1
MPDALSIGSTTVKADDFPWIEINTSDHPFLDNISVEFTSPFLLHQKLPGDIRNNACILNIDDIEPHSAENTIFLLQGKQQCGKPTNIVIYLAKHGSAPNLSRVKEYCQIFKQV